MNLGTNDAETAKATARKIRESSGGFRFVKAIGRYLPSRGCARVSMNFTNFAETLLDRVCGAIAEEAVVRSCQLVGFVPRRAYEMAPDFFGRAENFDESRVIETRIEMLERRKL